jgi:hypothetical protein
MQLQERRLLLWSFARCFQWSLPGHTWQSFLVIVVDFRARCSVVDVGTMASMSVSNGFELENDRGVERLLSRRRSKLFSRGLGDSVEASADTAFSGIVMEVTWTVESVNWGTTSTGEAGFSVIGVNILAVVLI